MFKLFARYTFIGVVNTLIHWIIFAFFIYILDTNQAIANLSGFIIAVSFSFLANAKITFKSTITASRYFLYVGFMGIISAGTGWIADKSHIQPVFTLVSFSLISLLCGFFYSKCIIFKDEN